MMKRVFLWALSLLLSVPLWGQNEVSGYEVTGFMPTYTEQIKSLLTYPLAWQNAGIGDFGEWRTQARGKVYELMQNLPPVEM